VAARTLSYLYWLLVAILALVMFPIAALIWVATTPFDRRRRVILHAFTNVWGSLYTWIHPRWTVKVRGRDRIDTTRPYVMVSNHLSVIDIFAMHHLSRHFKWVSKEAVFRIPFIGWNMRLNRYIPIRRGDKQSVLEMFERCREALSSGSSIFIFPEGTRSRSGELMAFKPGGFQLAKEVGVPIQPLVVQGTYQALPEGMPPLTGPAKMRITVLPLVPIEVVEEKSVEELTALVRGQIADFLVEDPWPLRQEMLED